MSFFEKLEILPPSLIDFFSIYISSCNVVYNVFYLDLLTKLGPPILPEVRVKIRNDSNLYIPPAMLYQTDNNPLAALPWKIGEL